MSRLLEPQFRSRWRRASSSRRCCTPPRRETPLCLLAPRQASCSRRSRRASCPRGAQRGQILSRRCAPS